MPSEEKLQQQADNKRGHALARIEARSVKVGPATVDITERIIFTLAGHNGLTQLAPRRSRRLAELLRSVPGRM